MIFCLILMSGISVLTSLQILAFCTLQICAGGVIVARFWFRRPLSIVEFFGTGFAVGVMMSVFFDQFLLKTPIAKFAFLVPMFVSAVILMTSRRIPIFQTRDAVEERREIVVIAIGVLAILGPEWYWTAVPALLLALSELVKARSSQVSSKKLRNLNAIFRLSFLSTLGICIYFRPSSWWIEESDFGFFEALSVSFSKWGISDNSLAFGSAIKYHWLVFAWSGLVTKVLDLPSWVMLTRAGTVVGVFALVSLAWACFSLICKSYKTQLVAFFMFCFFDTYPSWGSGFRIGLYSSPSQLIGSVWLLAILFVFVEQKSRSLSYSWLLYAVLFAGATLSKISHGAVALAGFIFSFLVKSFIDKKVDVKKLVDVTTSTTIVLLIFYFFYAGAQNTSISFLKFPQAIQGELINYSGIAIIVAGLCLILGFVGFHLFVLATGLTKQFDWRDAVFLFCFGSGASGLFFSLIIDVYMGGQIYFLHSGSILMLIFSAALAADAFEKLVGSLVDKLKVVVVISLGFLASVISWLIPNLDSGSISAIGLRLSRSLVLIIPITGALVISQFQLSGKKLKTFSMLGLVGLASLGTGFYISNWSVSLKREYASFDRNEESNLGSLELNQAMTWIEKSSDVNDIFASNNDSFLLSALSHRRGYLQSKYRLRRHTIFTPDWERELDARGVLLTEVFDRPTKANLAQLYENGVRWLVYDRSKSENLFLKNSSLIKFQNDEYLILDLS